MNRFDPSQNKPSESLRSEIDETRQRMNSTIDALTERLKGRHVLDELLGLLRSGNGTSAATTMKNKVSETTTATVTAVVDAVKSHPLPVLVMGAGLAWLIYEKERKSHEPDRSYAALEPEPAPGTAPETPDDFEDYTPGYSTSGYELAGSDAIGAPGADDPEPSGMKQKIQSTAGAATERIQEKASQLGNKAAQLGTKARQSLENVKQRTAQASAQMRERTRDLAMRTRENVSRAAEEHPLEAGLTVLALGLVAGLLTPAPQRLRDEIDPVAQRLKQRARDMGEDIVARGKRVVSAASDAARTEAESQGLTPEAMLRGKDGPTGAGASTEPGMRRGEWPGQTENASTPTPAEMASMSSDEQRARGAQIPPASPLPPQPTL